MAQGFKFFIVCADLYAIFKSTIAGGFMLNKSSICLLLALIAIVCAQSNYEIMFNRPDIVGLTGGGATKLDGIPTTGLAVGTILIIYDGSETRIYRLTAGTDAENLPTIIQPDDFADPENAKVWKTRISSKPEETGHADGYSLDAADGDPTDAVYVDNDGNVGIGTIPSAQLDVNGTAKMTGFQMPTGATNGYALTSDASGNGTWQLKPAGPSSVKITANQINGAVALADITGLNFAVTTGIYYHFRFLIPFRTAAAGTGIRLTLTFPATTVFAATVIIPMGADGSGGEYFGWITSSGDVVFSPSVETMNVDYLAVIDGIILPSADGTLQVRFGSEVGGSNVTVKQGACGFLYTY